MVSLSIDKIFLIDLIDWGNYNLTQIYIKIECIRRHIKQQS